MEARPGAPARSEATGAAHRAADSGPGKSLRFDAQTVDELANSAYGQPDTFALLSILYGHVDPAETYHVDHVFPRAKMRRDRLRETGYPEEQVFASPSGARFLVEGALSAHTGSALSASLGSGGGMPAVDAQTVDDGRPY